jgi:hypothetical protein
MNEFNDRPHYDYDNGHEHPRRARPSATHERASGPPCSIQAKSLFMLVLLVSSCICMSRLLVRGMCHSRQHLS